MTPERAMELAKYVSFDERLFAAELIDKAHAAIREAILAAVTEVASSLSWTSTPPKEPGWYWREYDNMLGILHVDANQIEYFRKWGTEAIWAGPITPPAAPPQERPSDNSIEAIDKRMFGEPSTEEPWGIKSADRQEIEQTKLMAFQERSADPQPNVVVE